MSVPVVVPEGVGMLDELKHAYRYEAGNYEAMKNAVRNGSRFYIWMLIQR